MLGDKIKKIIAPVSLFLIFCSAFFIRVYFCYRTVFYDGMTKYIDDANYHMRLLENMLLGGHFPHQIYFDPFTYFPHGTYNNIAPFYDFLLAFIIWLASFGKPTLEIINKIAPFYPVVLGSLISIVVYFIAKALWNDPKISLASAFFAAIIPPILYKSVLGSNDHHVAEILYSSLSIMFLLYALKFAKTGIFLKNIKFWVFILLCGFSLGIYFLTWPGAILFLFIIFVFLSIYCLMEFIAKKPTNWILLSGGLIFITSFLMILPFFGHPNIVSGVYNINHLISFSLGLLSFLVLWIFIYIFEKKSIKKRWMILPLLTVFLIVASLALKILSPDLFDKIIILINGVNTNGADLGFIKNFISEMRPLRYQGAIDNFSSLFFFFILGFSVVFYNFLKEKKPEYLLLIIWTIATFLIVGIIPSFGQMRFYTYFSVSVVLMSGFSIVKSLEFGWKSLNISSRLDKGFSYRIYFLVGSLAILSLSVFFLVYPFPFNAGASSPNSLPDIVKNTLETAENPNIISQDLYDILGWLKEKTPDPGLDYYALYKEPGIDKKTGQVADYSYPAESYSILAQWDLGHMITYVSHRIPVANPFQQGIGRKVNGEVTQLGEGVFFLETDENKAISYLDQLRSKYVITNSEFASSDAGYFKAEVEIVQGSLDGYLDDGESSDSPSKFDDSMIARLHLLDGCVDVVTKKINGNDITFTIKTLEHFRLLYESKTTGIILTAQNLNVKQGKIFEYVKGAEIKGYAVPGTQVKISTNVKTNQGRSFTYKNETVAQDGSFDFIVPYSTGNQEQSDVSASDYTIKIGNYSTKVKVSEDDILQGRTLTVNL